MTRMRGLICRRPGKEPADRPEQVALALEELRRRSDGMSRRSESLSARAGILVASSALVAALQQGNQPDIWLASGTALSLIAAALGLIAIFPRRSTMPSVQDVRSTIYSKHHLADAEWWLVDQLVNQYESGAKAVEFRGRILRAGFVALSVGLLTTAISVVASIEGGDMGKHDLDPADVPEITISTQQHHEFSENEGSATIHTRITEPRVKNLDQ